MDFIDFLKNNLSHVLPLLVAGAFAIVIIAERTKSLFFSYPLRDSKGFFDKVQELVFAGRTAEAVQLCEQQGQKPVAKVVRAALMRAHLPDDAIEQGIALELADATRHIQKRTSFVATIANVATLLGLLGTIAGLIASFAAVAHADAQQKSALLSAGISTAMNATMLGLAIAIPCMIAFAVLTNKANRIIGDLEDAGLKTLDVLKLRYYSMETEETPSVGETLSSLKPTMNGEKAALRRVA